jgi:hypothetical protein
LNFDQPLRLDHHAFSLTKAHALSYSPLLLAGGGAFALVQNYFKCGAIESAHKSCQKFATLEKDKQTQNEFSQQMADNYIGTPPYSAVQYGQALARSAFICSDKKPLEDCLTARGYEGLHH